MEISLPFTAQFERVLLTDIKTCTTRSKRFGRPGDVFRAYGAVFELLKVEQVRLDEVAAKYWQQEGCASPEHFIRVWEQIHPIKGFDSEWLVWLHTFRKIGPKISEGK